VRSYCGSAIVSCGTLVPVGVHVVLVRMAVGLGSGNGAAFRDVEAFEEDSRGGRNLEDGGVERLLVDTGRFAEAADLPYVLEGGLVQLLLRRPALGLT